MPLPPDRRATLAVLVVAASSWACGGGDPDAGRAGDEPRAVPAPELTTFTQGDFDDLPVFRGATQIEGPARDGSAISAGYETETATPRAVVSWYEERLADEGWQLVEPVAQERDGTWTGDWVQERRRLQVVAAPYDEPREGEFDDVTQTRFDLVLRADAGDAPTTAP